MAKRTIAPWFLEHVPQEVSESALFKFTVNLNDRVIEIDLRVDLGIDYSDIQQQLADTPSMFAFWAAVYTELKGKVAFLERRAKVHRGKITQQLVSEIAKANGKTTDKQVQAIVEADETLSKIESMLLILQKQTGKVYYVLEAMKMKCDNLRSLAGFARMEMGQGQ